MAAEDSSNEAWRGNIVGHCATFIAFSFPESIKKRLGGPGIMEVCGFLTALTFLIANDKVLINTFL